MAERYVTKDYSDDLIGFYRSTIRVRSYSDEEGDVAKMLVEKMKDLGYDDAYIDPAGNVVGRVGDGPCVIHFDSHMDNVQVNDPENWDAPPFSADLLDGYVYGQSVRGADAEFKQWVLSSGYSKDLIKNDDGNEITFTHKSRIYPKKIHVNITKSGQEKSSKKEVVIDQKQMAYYSEKYAKKQKADRQAMIERAKDLINHPKKYDRITAKGSSSYIRNIAFDKSTGEIIEGRGLLLDLEKIQEEEKYDGYYSIVTSELKMSDEKMRDTYRGLARIEDSFKVTKTCFESRPVYVWTNDHIDAHFATCFLALVLICLLEVKLGNQFPTGQMLDSLKKYNCTHLSENRWQFTYYDEMMDECGKAFDISLNNKYRTQQEIQRLLKY